MNSSYSVQKQGPLPFLLSLSFFFTLSLEVVKISFTQSLTVVDIFLTLPLTVVEIFFMLYLLCTVLVVNAVLDSGGNILYSVLFTLFLIVVKIIRKHFLQTVLDIVADVFFTLVFIVLVISFQPSLSVVEIYFMISFMKKFS